MNPRNHAHKTPRNHVPDWFTSQGWKPFTFQRQTWSAYGRGRSGLVHAPTGTGKTLAAWLGPVMQWLREHPQEKDWPKQPPPIQVLWLTPLRALTNDTVQSLRQPIEALGLPWNIEARTGDVSPTIKRKQRTRLPSALVTTPESLSLLLSYPESAKLFSSLRCVVVDEWHELMSTKRGTQAELGIARLRRWNPSLQVWGMSATLGNLDEAMNVLMGPTAEQEGVLIHGKMAKAVTVESVLPASIETFPWSGHLGLHMLESVLERIASAGTTLLFTNTRSQSEIWFNAITHAKPDWLGKVALHHGSIDRDIRQRVEQMTRDGKLRCVVCTSSLDLGVDFTPVDQVIQIGSPKGIGRLMQRAGRSGHAPGKVSRVVCVPTHAWELIEFSAARQAVKASRQVGGGVESRPPVRLALDVLVQHVVSMALADSFDADELYEEVCRSHAFAQLTRQQWSWVMDFVTRGGPALGAYPDYARVKQAEGRYHLTSPRLGRLHRMTIGTITSDVSLSVRFTSGKRLGSVEESFVGWLKPGDKFVFAGRMLQLVAVRDMTAWVRRTTGRKAVVPRWYGGRSPLSTKLAAAVRKRLQAAAEGRLDDDEMKLIEPLLVMQGALSRIPREDELLIETAKSRDGQHAFVYPFEGRLVNEGLGALSRTGWQRARR